MIFNSFDFFVVFPVLFLLYWLIPSKFNKIRNTFLLIVSYLLYMNWEPTFAIVLLSVTVVTYMGGGDIVKNGVTSKNSLGLAFLCVGSIASADFQIL